MGAALSIASQPDHGTELTLVLMDIVMPDLDGVTATRAIRQQYPEVQVVALTSFRFYRPSKSPPSGGDKTPPTDGCGRGSFVV